MNKAEITVNEEILAKIKEVRPEFVVRPKIGEKIFISEKLRIWAFRCEQVTYCLLSLPNRSSDWREEAFNEFLKEKYPEAFL